MQIARRLHEAAAACLAADHLVEAESLHARRAGYESMEVNPFCTFPRSEEPAGAAIPPLLPGIKALAVADKMQFCNRAENVWHGSDLHTSEGDLFEGCGVLWACNERLCPSCLANRARVARSVVRKAIKRPRPLVGQRWRFVTLTMPTRPASQSSLLTTLQVVTRAWRLFSKREWWRDIVAGGIKGVEFTLGNDRKLQEENREWSPETDGYHVHMHLLVLSRWVEWKRLREEWSTCLKTAWREFGIDDGINTRDGLAVCDVRLVVSGKGHGRDTISVEGAILEVAKYVTKSESWDKIPVGQLVEVASLDRWPRMFEVLGSCRAPAVPRAAVPVYDDCETLEAVTVQDRLDYLQEHGNQREWEFYLQARGQLIQFGELRPDWKKRLIELTTAYLDTPNLSGGCAARAGPLIRPKKRSRSLRQVGAELIAAGNRNLWRATLAFFTENRRSFRRSFQSRTYPFATFRDLVGQTWYGLAVSSGHASAS